MEDNLSLSEIQKEWHGSLKGYLIGFVGSILLTAAAYFLVMTKLLSGWTLIFSLVGLGLLQAIVQLLFFLHLGQEAKPRWELIIFLFMALVLFIIAGGSLWIMYDLNNRVMAGM